MRALLDTSVLVPALVEAHPRHLDAFAWLQRARRGEISAFIAAHSMAEVYAVLTRLPVKPRIPPSFAVQLIREDILRYAEIVPLGTEDYIEVIVAIADLGIVGGATYDALIARAAMLASVDALVTANAGHFRLVCPQLGDRIVAL
jgi:predicted nucleic acid-binding protein